jgi:hypothetical protein
VELKQNRLPTSLYVVMGNMPLVCCMRCGWVVRKQGMGRLVGHGGAVVVAEA